MSADDIAAHGAEPLFFLDYISVGKLVPEQVDEIVAGVAKGCRDAGCALIGGEMSEHPGLLDPGEFDIVGFAVGVVDRSAILPAGVQAGDAIIGIASPGLRSNGYSLARRALLDRAGRSLEEPAWRGAHHSLGEELLVPERDLREGAARSAASRAGARVRARHRRGHPRQPRARPAAPLRTPWSGAVGGRSRASSRSSRRRATSPTTRWSRCSTSASGCSPCCRAGRPTGRSTPIRSAGHDAWLIGRDRRRPGRASRSSADRLRARRDRLRIPG